MSELAVINPGDVVAILEHQDAPRLYPDRRFTEPASEGWVVTGVAPLSSRHDPRWPSNSDEFMLEKLPEPDTGWSHNQVKCIERRHLRVQRAGPGTFTRGVDLPLNKMQERNLRFDAFREKVAAAIVSRGDHEGWVNPATWHVNLQLTNCQHFMNVVLPSLWRKDGSVNPARLGRVWIALKSSGLVSPIEDWMLASPIDVPSEFAGWRIAELQALRVSWDEIAADLARKPAKT